MKKWLIGLFVLLIIAFFCYPGLLQMSGIYTTRVMVYNGNNVSSTFELNGQSVYLTSGETQVYRTSRFRNTLNFSPAEGEALNFQFPAGQHVINLGEAIIQIREVYFPFDEKTQEFAPFEVKPRDRLLFDATLQSSMRTLDTCYDCCIILPPGERPFRFLKPQYKDKRVFVSIR